MGNAHRGRRYRLEHHPPARRRGRAAARSCPLDKERVRLSLGEEIERQGGVSETSIATAAKAVRQALLDRAASRRRVARRLPDRAGPAERERRRAHRGACSAPPSTRFASSRPRRRAGSPTAARSRRPTSSCRARIAVCDVGGASTEIAVGSPGRAPDWVASVDLGSVRLSARADDLARGAPRGGRRRSRELEPPQVDARARRRRQRARRAPARRPVARRRRADRGVAPRRDDDRRARSSRRFGVDRSRARILPAGVAILAQVHELLGVPLHVCDGGIREGAVLETMAALAA